MWWGPRAVAGTLGLGVDRDLLAVAALALEPDDAVREGEQRVVLPQPDVRAGMDARAALADQDVTGANPLAAEPLDAEPLAGGIAPVPGRPHPLLMRHRSIPPRPP